MKLNKTLFFCILSVIIGIVFFQRTYKITQNPPSLFSDEVDAGYQAVCFNRHLTDYHGNFLPTSFHSFSDWRTPLYIYSIAALLKLHLPTDLSVRLPAAIFGILSIFVFSLILYQLWSKKIPIFLLSFFLASVSPWLFHYSRSGFEVTGMLFCLLTAILFLVIFYKHTKPLYLLFSGLFFISSIYFYSTSKLYIALIAPLIFILFYKKIFSLKLSQLALISFLCLVFLFPYIKDSLNG
ncbi:MAG TPA: glycosyltransferase family 39 protein, partial [Patescibacteria group bacterium]